MKKNGFFARKINAGRIACLALGLLAAISCSVKEDRIPCPCYLNVSFTDREHIDKPVGLVGWNETELFRETIDVAEHDPYWVKSVRKCHLWLAACMGIDKAHSDGRYVTIPVGEQADSLYAYHTEVDATGELAYAEVTLRKQFATVHVDILKRASEMADYSFRVKGGTSGFDLFSFEPVPGEFRFDPVVAQGARVVDFRIPRQSDNSMTIQIWYRGTDVGEFPLGQYIARTGYNWKAEDLQDIYIAIDLVLGQIIISVEGWEDGVTYRLIEQ